MSVFLCVGTALTYARYVQGLMREVLTTVINFVLCVLKFVLLVLKNVQNMLSIMLVVRNALRPVENVQKYVKHSLLIKYFLFKVLHLQYQTHKFR
jgi:hypothetical protein